MAAYYNEIDGKAAAWLRELIKAGLIADGEVDERSIVDVRPDDLRGFVQYHFFAGIGGWSKSLRLAGWSDERPAWTMSCPCQPFSAAGKGDGFADERHLWPAGHWLIDEHRPHVVFGEQVESPAGRTWFDLVSTDMEGLGYACGASDLPVASVGAPGIRQRLFWVADRSRERCDRKRLRLLAGESQQASPEAGRNSEVIGMAVEPSRGLGIDRRSSRQSGHVDEFKPPVRLVDRLITRLERLGGDDDCGCESRRLDPDTARSVAATGATRGAWAGADWLYCRDEKFRPVEPGTFPLAYGVSARVGRLRGYGNAINPEVAAAFIRAYDEC